MIVYMLDGCTCRVVDREGTRWYEFTGASTGTHRLAVAHTPWPRLLAHWAGYLRANGGGQ